MGNFIEMRDKVNLKIVNFIAEAKLNNSFLYVVDVNKNELWDIYLSSFLPKDNPMFRERTEHDCNCCRQFINAVGGLVIIKPDFSIESIWDIEVDAIYQKSISAMHKTVLNKAIKNRWFHYEHRAGNISNYDVAGDINSIQWDHFYCDIPNEYFKKQKLIASTNASHRENYELLKSSIQLINIGALDQVIELINNKSLYRGEEFLKSIKEFRDIKAQLINEIGPLTLDNYFWLISSKIGSASKFKNTVIGTLLVDITKGIYLEDAVAMYTSKVDPNNYHKPTALITTTMVKKAQETIEELGLKDALNRRMAVIDDVPIDQVLYVDKAIKSYLEGTDLVFNELLQEIPDVLKTKTLNTVKEISIDEFMNDIVPQSDKVELCFDPKLKGNLMTLVTGSSDTDEKLFKWDNDFSWAYNGDITDSMKERVKAHGGKVDGVLRFSLQWNEDENFSDRNIDLDAHCIDATDTHIYFSNKYSYSTHGTLDVDILVPGNKIAVENITWPDINKMKSGIYQFWVHNYSYKMCSKGFKAEIEFNNQIFNYEYNKPIRGYSRVEVADVTLNSKKEFGIEHRMKSNINVSTIWGIQTNKFHPVNFIMKSPNYWENSNSNKGNKHMFFILDQCHNNEPVRTVFNEFLREELIQHRKVFEVLGSKMKATPIDNQLSGFGFSSTLANSVLFRVQGKVNSLFKVKF